MTDIEDDIRIRDALKAQESQMRLFADNIPGPIAYLDRNLKYTFVNQAFANSVCKPQDEIYGKTPFEVHGVRRRVVPAADPEARAGRRARRVRAHRHDTRRAAALAARPHRARPRRVGLGARPVLHRVRHPRPEARPSRRWPRARSSCACSTTTSRSRSSTCRRTAATQFVNEAFLRLVGLDRDAGRRQDDRGGARARTSPA